MLGYRIDLYFHDYKLTKKIDESGYRDRNVDFKIKRQKAIEREHGFNIFKTINEIFGSIKQSSNQLTEKTLIDKISMRLLKLEFQSDNTIKSKTI